ncbi:hypothetical protein ACFLYA_02660, partial [Candidatus Dependentiae bacterium]
PIIIIGDGSYHLLENIKGSIIIGSNNVVLDLNGFTILDGADVLITVTAGLQNVLIQNGSIVGNGQNIGIKIEQGAKGIRLEDLYISNCNIGTFFDGSPGNPITCCGVDNCFTTSCKTGYWLEFLEKSVFENCEVCNGLQAGFFLDGCKYNKFKHCMVVGITNIMKTQSAVGYWAVDGVDNLFFECFVEGIQKKGESDWCQKAMGFRFTGTERESKIVNCLVDSVSSESLANTFGIKLEMTLSAPPVVSVVTKNGAYGVANDVDWSPSCGFIATCTGDEFQVLKFCEDELTIIVDDKTTGGSGDIVALAWSYDGRYLALLTNDFVSIYDVYQDPDKLYDSPDNVTPPAWDVVWFHKSYKFAVVSDDRLEIFSFDGDKIESKDFVTGTGVSGDKARIDISPDDKFIAISDNDTLAVYNASDLNGLDSVSVAPSIVTVYDLAFNPVACCGKYYIMVTGNDGTGPDETQLFDLDASDVENLSLIGRDSIDIGGNNRTLTWSPDGKYLCISAGGGDRLYFASFDPEGTYPPDPYLTLEFQFDPAPPTARHIDWSPCGDYIVLAGETGVEIIKVADSVKNCLIDGNKVANGTSQLCAIGIFGSSCTNCITRNIGYENCINFSEGVYNVFYNGLAGDQGVQGNWSIPPY